MKRIAIFAAIVGLAVLAGPVFAGEGQIATVSKLSLSPQFKSDVEYTITYEVSKFEVDIVENARVARVESIGGVAFLVITKSGFSASLREGFIRLETIKAILPTKHIVPTRTVVKE